MTMQGFLRDSLFSLGLLSIASLAEAEVRKCGAVWTDKPCVEGAPASTPQSRQTPKNNPPLAESPAPAQTETQAPAEPVPSSEPPTPSPPNLQQQIKPLIMERPEPWMDWRREEKSDTKWVFKGKLKGNGKTRISLVISKASYTGNLSREYVEANRIFNLPSWGGETEFEFPVDVPPPLRTWNWRWFLKAEYVGKWNGYRDFRGCCGARDIEARCNKDGSVQCSPGKVSETCRCY